MKWYSVEMPINVAEVFHDELMERNIKHEMSACFHLIHFEVLLNEWQLAMVNSLIDASYEKACVTIVRAEIG